MPRPVLPPVVLDAPLELGDGVVLRVPTRADAPAIAAACQDPDIIRFTRVPHPYTAQDGYEFVAAVTEAMQRGHSVTTLAVEAASGVVLGCIGVDLDPADLSAEIGYWMTPQGRGRRIATRGTHRLARYAFEELGVGYLTLHASARNAASQRIAEKLGFRPEGRQVLGGIDGPSGDRTAERVDMLLYGMRPGELQRLPAG